MKKRLLETLEPEIQKTVTSLSKKKFSPDPISGKGYSKVASIVSSAYKRHGFILERAVREVLKLKANLVVWSEPVFFVTPQAAQVVQSSIDDPTGLFDTNNQYKEFPNLSKKELKNIGANRLQLDIIVFDKKKKKISAYEVKRGAGLHDSGKQRSILRDVLSAQVLLKSYAQKKGYKATKVGSYVIFYYGKCSVGEPFAIKGGELDHHFGTKVYEYVEAVNDVYKRRLRTLLTKALSND
jgi:hypothetical protein